MAKHAKLSPSAAVRWLSCTKSVELIQEEDNQSSFYADEGSRAHELLEARLKEEIRQWN